jgi:hypothetical protein
MRLGLPLHPSRRLLLLLFPLWLLLQLLAFLLFSGGGGSGAEGLQVHLLPVHHGGGGEETDGCLFCSHTAVFAAASLRLLQLPAD